MKILTKKKEAEEKEILFRKLCFVAHVVYEKYAPNDNGVMKDVNKELVRICDDIFASDDVLNPITSQNAPLLISLH